MYLLTFTIIIVLNAFSIQNKPQKRPYLGCQGPNHTATASHIFAMNISILIIFYMILNLQLIAHDMNPNWLLLISASLLWKLLLRILKIYKTNWMYQLEKTIGRKSQVSQRSLASDERNLQKQTIKVDCDCYDGWIHNNFFFAFVCITWGSTRLCSSLKASKTKQARFFVAMKR